MTAVRLAIVSLVTLYQRTLSPLLGPMCRFYPSCSQYAKEAVLKHGVRHGVSLAVRRIVRCNPWHAGGIDAVP